MQSNICAMIGYNMCNRRRINRVLEWEYYLEKPLLNEYAYHLVIYIYICEKSFFYCCYWNLKRMQNTLIITLVVFSLNSLSYGFICSNDGIFVDPDNQQTYFQCASGIAYLMSCPSGLYWNQINLVCTTPPIQGL